MKPLVTATVRDATGIMEATFFNQPWLQSRYTPGTKLILTGKYQARNRFRVNQHAVTQGAVGAEVATYPATEGLIEQPDPRARPGAPAADPAHDRAAARPPAGRGASCPTRAEALDEAHFGDTEKGRRRLAFDELLLTQLAFLRRRLARRDHTRALPLGEERVVTDGLDRRRCRSRSRRTRPRAMATIDEDLADDRPMQRLLMGEVGSGKTVVAVYAMLRAVEHGAQAA